MPLDDAPLGLRPVRPRVARRSMRANLWILRTRLPAGRQAAIIVCSRFWGKTPLVPFSFQAQENRLSCVRSEQTFTTKSSHMDSNEDKRRPKRRFAQDWQDVRLGWPSVPGIGRDSLSPRSGARRQSWGYPGRTGCIRHKPSYRARVVLVARWYVGSRDRSARLRCTWRF
jgi:hypothetical protein